MYQYFKLSLKSSKRLADEYNENIAPKRQAIIDKFLAQAEATGYTLIGEWGAPGRLHELVYDPGHEIAGRREFTTKACELDGVPSVVVSGVRTTALGMMYYEAIESVNQQVAMFPLFEDWLRKELNVIRFAFGPEKLNGARDKLATDVAYSPEGAIFLRVPEGHEGQSPINASNLLKRITEDDFKHATTIN